MEGGVKAVDLPCSPNAHVRNDEGAREGCWSPVLAERTDGMWRLFVSLARPTRTRD